MCGPLWLGPLHQSEVADAMVDRVEAADGTQYASQKKLAGLLSVVRDELNDVPMFYNLSDLCKVEELVVLLFSSSHPLSQVLRSPVPSMHLFRSALLNAGYRVSGFHTEPFGFKSDAPMHVIWDVLRCWKKQHGSSKEQPQHSPAHRIMSVEPTLQADFTPHDQAKVDKKKRPRFIKVDGWGPKTRAQTGTTGWKKVKTDEEEEKK